MIEKKYILRGEKLKAAETALAWQWGDLALEVEPITRTFDIAKAGHTVGTATAGVAGRCRELAERLDVDYGTLMVRRSVASSWPEEHRRHDLSWSVHQRLQGHPDRFDLLKTKDWRVAEAAEEMRKYRGGYKPLHEKLSDTSVVIRVSWEMHASLKALSRVENIPMEELVRGWIAIMLSHGVEDVA